MKHSRGSDGERPLLLSTLLLSLAENHQDPIRLADIVAHFGPRAFGAVLFIVALINLIPLTPGSQSVLGLPLLIIAPQLALGAGAPWLPRFLAERSVSRSLLNRLCRRAAP